MIRLMEPADLPAVHELYGATFGSDPLASWKRRWHWQFVDHPACRFAPARFWVAELSKKVVGFLASFPVRFWIDGREMTGRYPCDLMAAPSAAGHGLGLHLVRAYFESADNPLPNALQYTLGNGLIHERLGYAKLWIQPVYLRPYNLVAVGRAVLVPGDPSIRAGRTRAIAALGLPVLHALAIVARAVRSPRAAAGIVVERVDQAGPDFDDLWIAARGDFTVIPVRNRDWVAWRFWGDPVHRHVVLLARERATGRPVGYIALTDWSWRGLSVGRITDLFASPHRPEVVRTLVAAALDAFEARVDLVSCLGLHPHLRSVVQRYLFVAPRRLSVSARVKWKGDPALTAAILDPAGWHVSYADGDDAFG